MALLRHARVMKRLVIVLLCEVWWIIALIFRKSLLFSLAELVKPHAADDIVFGESSFNPMLFNCSHMENCQRFKGYPFNHSNVSDFDDDVRSKMNFHQKMPIWLLTLLGPLSSVTTVALFGSSKVLQAGETLDQMALRVGDVSCTKNTIVFAFAISSVVSLWRDVSLTIKIFAGRFAVPLQVSFVLATSSLTKTAWSLLGLRAIYAKSMDHESRTETSTGLRPFFSLHIYKSAFAKLKQPRKFTWGSDGYRKLMCLSQGHLWLWWSQVVITLYGPLSFLTAILATPALVMTLMILPLSGALGFIGLCIFAFLLLGLHTLMQSYPIFIRWVLQHKKIYFSTMLSTVLITLGRTLGPCVFTSLLAIGAVAVSLFLLLLACKRLCSSSTTADQMLEPLATSVTGAVNMRHVELDLDLNRIAVEIGVLGLGLSSVVMVYALPAAWAVRRAPQKTFILITLSFLFPMFVDIDRQPIYFQTPFMVWWIVFNASAMMLFLLFMCGHFFDARIMGALAEELVWGDALYETSFGHLWVLGLEGTRKLMKPLEFLTSTEQSRARFQRRLERLAQYDDSWVQATGAEEADWQENFLFSVAIPLLFPTLVVALLRMYAGDGVLGSFLETFEDRHFSTYLMALNTQAHESGVLAASVINNTNITVFDSMATWAESFNLYT